MVRGFGGRESDLLKILFDRGAKVGGLQRATKACENLSLGGEEEGIGNGFYGFEEVECFGSRANEGVANAMALCKNEEASGWSFVQRNT